MLFCSCLLIFVIYGILTPIYAKILDSKLSNQRAFYIAWTTAPYLVAYFYSPLVFYPFLVIFNIISYTFALKRKINLLIIALFSTAILGELIYSLVFYHTNYA
ncbi:hypothetical protein [Sulfurisphaera tokodaii]|uniref:Uncharacterized protein n=2 Tax=Sulfurisphaera tokodaii TaxID=111955 RepID=Q972B7_SULTO|nr:hypothetical protein [Sulfurisphaera tokodaii]BAB66252.1 hypothetical protein STK_12110 [Sulfurisphaera tokodaii str. 7]HII73231.1 hypothetical protein [Sulfurisphaera tokodaii]